MALRDSKTPSGAAGADGVQNLAYDEPGSAFLGGEDFKDGGGLFRGRDQTNRRPSL